MGVRPLGMALQIRNHPSSRLATSPLFTATVILLLNSVTLP
jgi:hypothetical protein